ncbi:MAG: hypothetical protein AAFY88_15390 [Acidobacteriota bacterium]
MPTLPSGKRTTWKKSEKYATLTVDWAADPGQGNVSVTQRDELTQTAEPPKIFAIKPKKDGALANNTDQTISYSLKK